MPATFPARPTAWIATPRGSATAPWRVETESGSGRICSARTTR